MSEELTEQASESRPAPSPSSEPGESIVGLILTLLSLLNKRVVSFFGHLLPLIALASGFILWWKVLPEPSPNQLIGLGGYATFMLLILWVRR